jgi:translation initiation factor 2B subunit (eIF-2B alpha/beta/delta family)
MSKQAIEAFENKLHELLEDNRSGSRLIALRAAALMETAAADPVFSRTALIKLLKDACRSLERIHGAMRVVTALCDDVVLILDTAPPEDELRRKLAELFNRWNDLYRNRVITRLLANSLPLLRDYSLFISHSQSSTVLSVLSALAKERQNLKVIQTISAPNNEGLQMARMLADAGLEVELIADAGLTAAVARADITLLGADVVGLEGVFNKIGSYSIALAAQRFSKPVFVIFDSGKLLQPGREVRMEERDPAELFRSDHEHIKVRNVYFERVPLELFTRFITEEGDYDCEQIKMVIENLKDR